MSATAKPVDASRRNRISAALAAGGLDGCVCALGLNVLMLSGHWPIVGTSAALASRAGGVLLIVPEDEQDIALDAGVDEVITYTPGSLDELRRPVDALGGPLAGALSRLHLTAGRIGLEAGPEVATTSYASMHGFGASLRARLQLVAPLCSLVDADPVLASLRAVTTPLELERIRTACSAAARAFARWHGELAVGRSEIQAATALRAGLILEGHLVARHRAEAFAWCMAGLHSGIAYGAHARSTRQLMEPGDLVLVHCNSEVDGYWTDITRTFLLGPPTPRTQAMLDAVLDARQAAFAAIRPGVAAAQVDAVARRVIADHGFGDRFYHATGHGVGFAAIDHLAPPRLHPKSPDVLEPGMVFNVEPGVYFEDFGGIRHCDVVAVTDTGMELLTPFLATPEELVIDGGGVAPTPDLS